MKKKKVIRIILSVVLISIAYCIYWLVDRFNTFEIYGQGTILTSDFKEEIPFEFRNGHIIIKAKVNSQTYPFIFDTGASNYIFTNQLSDQTFEKVGDIGTVDANGVKSTSDLIKVPSLQIGGVLFEDLTAQEQDFNFPCLADVAGIIGRNTLRHSVWQIDYQKKLIRIADDIKKLEIYSEKIPAHVNRYSFIIESSLYINDTTAIDFMIDTGSSSWIHTSTEVANKINPFSKVKYIGASGNSLGGYNTAKLEERMLAKSFRIGSHKLDSIPVSYGASRPNLLGNAILQNYVLTISWKDKGVWLDPVSDSEKESVETFGFYTKLKDKQALVSSVVDFEAEASGIRPGDLVIAYNEFDFSTINKDTYCTAIHAAQDSILLTVVNAENDTLHYTFGKENYYVKNIQ